MPEFARGRLPRPDAAGRRGGRPRGLGSPARSRPRPGRAVWSPCRSGPTPSCSGTASRWSPATGLDMTQAGDLGPDHPGRRAGPRRSSPAQGVRGESLTVWVNALVESGGGSIITNPGEDDPALVQLGLDAPPGIEAARIIRTFGDAGVAPPGFPTADEDTNARRLPVGLRRVHGQLAVHLGEGDVRGRGGHAAPVGARRLRLGASTRSHAATGPARRRSAASTSGSARSASTRTSPTRPPTASPARRTSRTTSSRTATRPSRPSVFDDPEVVERVPDGPGHPRLPRPWPRPGRRPRTTPRSPAASSGPSTRRAR